MVRLYTHYYYALYHAISNNFYVTCIEIIICKRSVFIISLLGCCINYCNYLTCKPELYKSIMNHDTKSKKFKRNSKHFSYKIYLDLQNEYNELLVKYEKLCAKNSVEAPKEHLYPSMQFKTTQNIANELNYLTNATQEDKADIFLSKMLKSLSLEEKETIKKVVNELNTENGTEDMSDEEFQKNILESLRSMPANKQAIFRYLHFNISILYTLYYIIID